MPIIKHDKGLSSVRTLVILAHHMPVGFLREGETVFDKEGKKAKEGDKCDCTLCFIFNVEINISYFLPPTI